MLENIIELIRDYWQVFILEGLRYTLILSAIAVFFGVIFGAFIALGRMSNIKPFKKLNKKKAKKGFIHWLSEFNPVSWICSVYIEVIRGTPLLLQLYLFVFGLPKIIPISAGNFFWVSVALACNSAAYVSELFRSGIQAVDKGQTEAARSLGMNKAQTMMKVIMPQAIKNILPAVGNEFIAITKETSMASTFFIGDLMTSYLKVNGQTYLALEILIIVGAIYLAVTFVLSKLVLAYERRLNSK
ncbi:MAG: amino acid ABC transporter permease [Oscillospiraceae bacterium]|nr:amino acid ABC transporter permease [Oscillospiraceae bacterium]MBP1569764.1 amino acid ABC transporter permease [Oscillospiraceae bacterium]MBP1575039.1 amino acid ABC transporter permease [Oscillospiraceae bacterium]MBQ3531314.1 amino acid ABC transporter permease [Oscillospiraceae bacterium]MBQ5323799.1 amino acid ABC transporter permease [Oscillospiraceae bacterium]